MPGQEATERTSPVAYPMPKSTVHTASVARSTEIHRLGRARRIPARTTLVFHGTISTTVAAAIPCAMTTHRPRLDPVATAATPVATASSSATRSVTLVTRPRMASRLCTRR